MASNEQPEIPTEISMASNEQPEIPTESLRVNPQKLLNWVIKETGNVTYENMPEEVDESEFENVTRLINLSPEEREKWMTVLFGKPEDRISDTDRLQLAVGTLLNDRAKPEADRMSVEELEEILQNIHFLCEITYVAQNLSTVGGLDLIFEYGAHPAASIREHAIWILHTGSSNNVKFKARFLEHNGMERIVHLIREEDSNIVQYKLLGVLVNMIRQHVGALQQFFDLGCVDIIANWLDIRPSQKVFQRCILTLNELIFVNSLADNVLTDTFHIATLIEDGLQDDDVRVREKILQTIEFLLLHKKSYLLTDLIVSELLPQFTNHDDFADDEYRAELQDTVSRYLATIAAQALEPRPTQQKVSNIRTIEDTYYQSTLVAEDTAMSEDEEQMIGPQPATTEAMNITMANENTSGTTKKAAKKNNNRKKKKNNKKKKKKKRNY